MSDEVEKEMQRGLDNSDQTKWTTTGVEVGTALERLQNDTDFHQNVLRYLKRRLAISEKAMQNFYSRWQVGEKKVQAYVPAKDYEKLLEAWEKTKADPEAPGAAAPTMNVIVPYTYATIMTIVTYHLQVFAGRRPMFNLGANDAAAEDARLQMEILLQWNADHERLVGILHNFFFDGCTYGLGVIKTAWKEQKKFRTIWVNDEKTREERVTFQGTDICSVDPFMFFPDPRVPMSRVSRDGEFVFFRAYMGKHILLSMEADGLIKGVERAGVLADGKDKYSQSLRGMSTDSDLSGERNHDTSGKVPNYYRVDQGTVEIIPAELGLGTSTKPEKWLFMILNGNRVVQAEPFETDHDMHPCCVIEPYTQGYGFGQPSLADMVGPLQDVLSWFVNSHMRNVRTAINNMFLADPSKIEIQDLKNPAAGKIIRLKRTAYGQDVRQALQQLQVTDVTRGHIPDLQTFMRMADSLTGVTDNVRGLQEAGGRKTATEVRVSTDAGSSRLANNARLIAAQGVTDLAEQMILNFQQFGTMQFAGQILGPEGAMKFRIAPQQISGDFYYPIHDGTLPIDKMAMLDIWKEIFLAVSQDPQLSQEYSRGKMFEFMGELSGIRNLSSFKLAAANSPQIPASPEQIAGGAQSGALMPIPGLLPGQR